MTDRESVFRVGTSKQVCFTSSRIVGQKFSLKIANTRIVMHVAKRPIQAFSCSGQSSES